jgi:hypothetical protein
MRIQKSSSFKHLLFQLTGEDYSIISRCSKKIQLYFSLIGLLVLLILICSFVSALFFTENLFHNSILDIGVGVVWGFIITNMYVLVLYTISPQLLPTKNVDDTAPIIVKKLPSFSLLFRLFVLILLSVIIAQPINVLILKSSSTSLLNDIRFLLSNNFFASVITLIVVAIFLAPVYLKYIIRNFGEYFEKMKEVNMKIISRDYAEFKVVYSQILEERLRMRNVEISKGLVKSLARLKIASPDDYVRMKLEFESELKHEKLSKYEYWQDPPFRTVKSASVQSGLPEEELLKYIYTERK